MEGGRGGLKGERKGKAKMKEGSEKKTQVKWERGKTGGGCPRKDRRKMK